MWYSELGSAGVAASGNSCPSLAFARRFSFQNPGPSGPHSRMAKKLYLCSCHALRCGEQQTWSEVHGRSLPGKLLSRALYFCHQRLDRDCSSSHEDDIFASQLEKDHEQPCGGGSGTLELSPICLDEKDIHGNHVGKSEGLSQDTAALEAATHDINHIAKLINNRILSFATIGPLCFSESPHEGSLEYNVHQSTIPTEPNSGPLHLNQSAINQAILHHEDRLHMHYKSVVRSLSAMLVGNFTE
ncbi:hypothetical protein BKA83DRAFT_4131655 [Pisolithus microcarpus]|nr:hypothetical protein BKA83DRAFT_4131655 [Pisolithus microcarpus]